jgi:hypothetical protein
MKAIHLSDEQIQQYVVEGEIAVADANRHISSCEQCKDKAEAYRLLVTGLQGQPAERFDFSVTELVMQQLSLPSITRKTGKENALVYAIAFASVAIIAVAVYFFRDYVAGIFESIAPLFIYLFLTAFIMLSIFLIADIYNRYKRKMHTLDWYRS